jgi:hypothetical protein
MTKHRPRGDHPSEFRVSRRHRAQRHERLSRSDRIRHRASKFRARQQDAAMQLDVAETQHPTPAVSNARVPLTLPVRKYLSLASQESTGKASGTHFQQAAGRLEVPRLRSRRIPISLIFQIPVRSRSESFSHILSRSQGLSPAMCWSATGESSCSLRTSSRATAIICSNIAAASSVS